MATEIREDFHQKITLELFRAKNCDRTFLENALADLPGITSEITLENSNQKCIVMIQRFVSLSEAMPEQRLPINSLRISEKREWDFSDGGAAKGSFTISAPELQLEIAGQVFVHAEAAGVEVEITANAISRFPLFAAQIEKTSTELFLKLLKTELNGADQSA